MLKQDNLSKFTSFAAVFYILIFAVTNTAFAQNTSAIPTTNSAQQSSQVNTTPKPPQVNASSYILMDFHSGHVLASDNPNLQVEPASITKMMTAYVVFSEIKSGNLSLDDMITVSKKAWRTGGSKMFIEVDKQVGRRRLDSRHDCPVG